MIVRAVPVGCMPSGRFGSRIGLTRGTEKIFLLPSPFLLQYFIQSYTILSVQNFISLGCHSRCAKVNRIIMVKDDSDLYQVEVDW